MPKNIEFKRCTYRPVNPERDLRIDEREFLFFLTSQKFQGSEQLSKQARTAKVKQECIHCLSIVLSVDPDPSLKAEALSTVPHTANTKDI
jgi:hypothetical protein